MWLSWNEPVTVVGVGLADSPQHIDCSFIAATSRFPGYLEMLVAALGCAWPRCEGGTQGLFRSVASPPHAVSRPVRLIVGGKGVRA